jgi:methyltransferase (TIGR00027 family)
MKPISNMAFYCCGARMQDAVAPKPICGDEYAKLFMNDYGQRIYDKFSSETFSRTSMTVRHRIIDELLRQMLLTNPDACFVTIGAGFDSRPYRMPGGTWFELDEPQLIAYKDAHLPAGDCANPLRRLSINFATDCLEEKLSAISHRGPVVFILEGIFIYLNEEQTRKLIRTLNKLFPGHLLVCDLVNRDMVEKYGQRLRDIAGQMSAAFQLIDQPETIFSKNGYQVKGKISLVEVSVALGLYKIPDYFLKYFLKNEIEGNSVYVWLDEPEPALMEAPVQAAHQKTRPGPGRR